MTHSPRSSRLPPGALDRDVALLRAAETRLLYENADTGVAITVVIATLLAYVQWDAVPHVGVGIWVAYMHVVSLARFVLARRYWRASRNGTVTPRWNVKFVLGTALAAGGWSAATVALYPADQPLNEILIVFVIGGVMLGSASLLAARPEAFLTFLLPTGLITSLRVANQGDEQHLIMGGLGALFTLVTVITTYRFHRAIESSLKLRFANQRLIESLEQRVHERTAQLLEADQRKDEFLATLAHELRNPLAPIRFAVESLKRDALSPAGTHARDVIERQVAQLVRLVDDLLDVSRITANKIQLRREPLDLARLMTTAVESIAPLAAAAGHTLDVQLPAQPTFVDGDAARLVQVFANVLHNAVKFTPPGGHIAFSAEQHADVAVVRIRDSGVGIAADALPHVFEMFHQAEPALERATGGLGVGLSLARRLLQMHDGQIDIRSRGAEQGTEVEIRLMTAAQASHVADAPAAAAARRQLRVLIVEDNVDAAQMLELAVSTLGHRTRVTHDGESALTAASDFAPDVIFLDIGLPVMNGYDVARALRAQPRFRSVHIAAVTGWGQEADRQKAREAGCDSHFTKPLAPAALDELLSKMA